MSSMPSVTALLLPPTIDEQHAAVGAFTLERFDLPGLVTAAMIFVGLAIATVAAARRTFPARSQLDAGSVP